MNDLYPIRLSALCLFLVGSVISCNDYPTETVAKCHPDPKACEGFVSDGKVKQGKPDAAIGEQVFLTRCASCHGRDGRGDGKTDRGDFQSADWHKKWSDIDLENAITAGRGMKMPGQRLPRFELKSLVLHLRSMSSKPSGQKKTGY